MISGRVRISRNETERLKNMNINNNIKRLRVEKGYTQEKLANEINISFGHLSKIERGDASPRADTIYKIMNTLECSANELLMNEKMLNTGSEFMVTMERAERLPDHDKKIIIRIVESFQKSNLIDKVANGENLA